jgi:serralysin
MSAGTNSVPVAQPANPYLSGILWGNKWQTSGSPGLTTIVYANNTTYTPNATEITAYQQVLADIAKICNVTFVPGTAQTADILLSSGTFAQMNAVYGGNLPPNVLGIADPPGININPNSGDEQSWVFANRTNYSPNALNKGGYDYITWLHEIGHAMGLAHPHDTGGGSSTIYPGVTSDIDSYGIGNLNQGIFTTMSYNDGWDQYFGSSMPKQYGYQHTMMAFDVAALQYLYGENNSTALGNNTYVLPDAAAIRSGYQCIWDAGGIDTIAYYGNYACIIDLRAATLDPTGSYGAGGFMNYVYGAGLVYGGITIANKVTIEIAVGGNGSDYIVGNEAANQLYGYGGNDTLYGLGGNDFIWGGVGNDVIVGGLGADQLMGASGNDYLLGDAGADAFSLNTEVLAGDFDYAADFVLGTDYFILPAAYQGLIYFAASGGSGYGYISVGGGYYAFGAPSLTGAQLAAATYYY